VKTAEGVVLAVEKRVTSPLLIPASIEKISEIDTHIAAAVSGLTADARTLVDHGRVQAQQHRFSYNEPMPCESVTQALCDLALRFGEDDDDEDGGGGGGMARPFGVALLLAGWDPDDGPCLFQTDPSGTYVSYGARAIGSGAEGAQTALQEAYRPDLTLAEAEVLALATLKQVMEEKVTPTNVSLAAVAPAYKLYTPDEVKGVIERL
jgi:20S proteasome subunit alpha 5